MAVVNVTTTDTFNEWRQKTNQGLSLIGDISGLTTTETDLVAAINQARTDVDSVNTYIGDRTLPGSDTTLTGSLATLRGDIDSNDTDIADHESRLQTVEDLSGISVNSDALDTDATNIVDAVNEVNAIALDAQSEIGGDMATDYSGDDTTIISALNNLFSASSVSTLNNQFVRRDGVGDMSGLLTLSSSGVSSGENSFIIATGASDTTRITINTSGNVGVGRAPSSYKLDVQGSANATTLRYNTEDTDTRYLRTGGTSQTVSTATTFSGNTTFSDDLIVGSTTIASPSLTITEWVQDVIGGVFTSNSESGGISAVYDDSTGKVTLAIANNAHQHTASNISDFSTAVTNLLTATNFNDFSGEVKSVVETMISNNSESGISVTYDDSNGTLDFNVNDPTITLAGDVTGQVTMSNLGSVTINTTVQNASHTHSTGNIDGLAEFIQDTVGTMVSGNTESGIAVTYDDTNNEFDFSVSAGTGNIVNSAVTTAKIANDAVTQAKMANDSVGSAELASVVSLSILNSSGTVVKTIYGAGA